jgi:tetratricopeptide (TPR) repeat protein
MNQSLTFSNISELAMNNKIYDSSFTKNTFFLQLFPSEQSKIVTKSSLFARNLLKNHFKGIEIVNKLLDIVKKFQSFRDSRDIRSEIYKSLLKFSFIARTLPEDTRTQMLIRYYEQLKIRIDRLGYTPHFWLQYAMARIAIDDFPGAQNCLDTAYAKAYEDYDTCYLDAQQSRLWIQLARRELNQNKSMVYFEDAHKLLRRLNDDQYKFRQIETYQDYYNDKYNQLSNANKKKFLSFTKEMHEKLEGLRKGYFTETNRADYCYEKLNSILEVAHSV